MVRQTYLGVHDDLTLKVWRMEHPKRRKYTFILQCARSPKGPEYISGGILAARVSLATRSLVCATLSLAFVRRRQTSKDEQSIDPFRPHLHKRRLAKRIICFQRRPTFAHHPENSQSIIRPMVIAHDLRNSNSTYFDLLHSRLYEAFYTRKRIG